MEPEPTNPQAQQPDGKRTPIKKLAPPKGVKRQRTGGTMRRLAQARSNMSPAARRKLNILVGVGLLLGAGAVAGFLAVTKPWEPNDPPPTRAANQVGAEGMHAWVLDWSAKREHAAANRFLLETLGPEEGGKLVKDGGGDTVVSRSRELVKEHGIDKARTQSVVIVLTKKVSIDVTGPNVVHRFWAAVLAASQLYLETEKLEDAQQRFADNRGPLLEDLWVGADVRTIDEASRDLMIDAQVPRNMKSLGLWVEYRRLQRWSDGDFSFNADYEKRRIEESKRNMDEARELDEYRITEDDGG